MNLIQAIKRLSFTTSNGNKANDSDVDALNVIIQWINREKEERLNYNWHFAKITVYMYINLLIYHKGNKQICEREIQEVLEKPIEYWYNFFREELNRNEFNTSCEFLGIEDYYYDDLEKGILNLEKIRQQHKDKKEILSSKENQELLIKSLNAWSDKEVYNNLNHFLTELLNKYADK